MHNSDLTGLQETLRFNFQNMELLERALTHRSFVNEQITEMRNNERLEFLGDAVLELAVTEHLFEKYPSRAEGELTSFRAAIVRTESLAEVAVNLDLGEFIRMSKGEEATGGRNRPYILANTVEALIGAIYLDSSFVQAREFILKFVLTRLDEIVENRLDIDPKSRLQELAQELHKYTPTYEVIKEEGPDHERIFTVNVIIKDKSFGTGEGRSKQEAEQQAAKEALSKF